MRNVRVPALSLVVLAPCAAGQIMPVIQERTVQTQVMVSSGGSSGDFDEAATFSPFTRTITSSVTGAAGAGADASAAQDSTLGSALVTATLGAHSAGRTGSTFVTGESDAQSTFLFIFSLSDPATIRFRAAGGLAFVGRNPEGDPSDLSGLATVRLLDAITEDLVAGFQLNGEAASDSASFDGTLPAGRYALLATVRTHAFSADLLGPPPRSGSGDANASFSLAVVPAPGACALLAVGVLALPRRRTIR
jgi:hypothetical protein